MCHILCASTQLFPKNRFHNTSSISCAHTLTHKSRYRVENFMLDAIFARRRLCKDILSGYNLRRGKNINYNRAFPEIQANKMNCVHGVFLILRNFLAGKLIVNFNGEWVCSRNCLTCVCAVIILASTIMHLLSKFSAYCCKYTRCDWASGHWFKMNGVFVAVIRPSTTARHYWPFRRFNDFRIDS